MEHAAVLAFALICLIISSICETTFVARESHGAADDLELLGRSERGGYEQFENVTASYGRNRKRAVAPLCSFEILLRYRNKGEQLENYMLSTQHDLPAGISQSSTFRPKDVRNDWHDEHDSNSMIDMSSLEIDLHLEGLSGVQDFPSSSRRRGKNKQTEVTYDDSIAPWNKHLWIQDKEFVSRSGAILPPTNAFYEVLTSQDNKVVVVLNAASPKFKTSTMNGGVPKPDRDLPKVHRFSDISFISIALEWGMNIPDTYGARKYGPPWWWLIDRITGPEDTLSVITHCLTLHGWSDPYNLPSFDQRFTFPIGSMCYRAILGTKNSAGIAWFLIQHKYRFRDSALGSVTIWGSQTHDPTTGFERPTLLWWVDKSVVPSNWKEMDLVTIRAINVAHEMAHTHAMMNPPSIPPPWPTDWPWTLKPTYQANRVNQADPAGPVDQVNQVSHH